MQLLEISIDGMHCDGCARTIEALLAHEPGVQSASVSHATREGRVLYDPARTDAARIARTIEQAGYTVHARPAPGVR